MNKQAYDYGVVNKLKEIYGLKEDALQMLPVDDRIMKSFGGAAYLREPEKFLNWAKAGPEYNRNIPSILHNSSSHEQPMMMAHEMGHHINANKMGRFNKYYSGYRRIGGNPTLTLPSVLSSLIMKPTKLSRNIAIVSGLLQLPAILEEAIATGRGISALKKYHGPNKDALRGDIIRGIGATSTYAINAAAPSIAYGIRKVFTKKPKMSLIGKTKNKTKELMKRITW